MRVEDMHWRQVEQQAAMDDRAILPLGCTEQHAGLSLCTDAILAHRLSVEAAEPLGIPVFPVLSYGLTPSFTAYPGTVTLKAETYLRVVGEIVSALFDQGFRRLLILNGHGGNAPARAAVLEALNAHPGCRAIWHDWWIGPKTWQKVISTDPDASHASWMENFPWTRLPHAPASADKKPMIPPSAYRQVGATEAKKILGDGSFGGLYQRSDEEMNAVWQTALDEVKELLEHGWKP